MSFDKNDKKNKHIVDWFRNKSAVIYEPASMNRTSIKKMLIVYGLNMDKIYVPETFVDAKDFIANEKPDIVFTRDDNKGEKGLDLLDLHIETIPNRLNTGFFLVSEDNSPSISAVVLDTEVDGILTLPFTGASLEKIIKLGLKKKYKPNPYNKMIEEAKGKMVQGDVEGALQILKSASDMNKTPVLSNCYIAKILISNNDEKEAEEMLLENLNQNTKHYLSLKELAKLYKHQSRFKDQYDMTSRILDEYAMNPEKIPDLTKLSIQNEKYEDIWNYAKVFSTIKTPSLKITQFISAGLAICGRFMVKTSRPDEGKKAILKSAKMAHGKFEILKSLAESLLLIGDKEGASKLLNDHANENTDEIALEVFQFEIFARESLTPQTLERGRKLLNSEFKAPEIYQILIEKLISGNMKIGIIEEMVDSAKKDFPDLSDQFQQLLEKAQSNAA
ncbi:hypothetical protein A9Q84_15940 [Halobacteriovorax marinus]|uniref:Response regulatory domain-containing protein n=1 Tax=Halobacteriovorax marinus TaxID=97084 RepID=A0A1Y5F440_9BACT|nr:hypothetical protein A9Q84_15940 [Halobacteriovorax marinus]